MESQHICKNRVIVASSMSIFSSMAHKSHPLIVLNVNNLRRLAVNGLNKFCSNPIAYNSSNFRKSIMATSWISFVKIGDAAN